MRNVEFEVKGSVLTIRVDLTKRLGPSKSGKTEIIASTDGIFRVEEKTGQIGPGGKVGIGLNVFTDRQPGSGF